MKRHKKRKRNKLTETPFNKRCEILADLWLNYRNDQNFEDFINYNDLALPFAYGVANHLLENISADSQVANFIDEAWRLLLEGLGIEDFGFDNLDDLLGIAE